MTRRRRRQPDAKAGEHVLRIYRDGRRFVFVNAQCHCGWVSEGHRSRGDAKREWEGHVYLTTGGLMSQTFGVDAHRRPPR